MLSILALVLMSRRRATYPAALMVPYKSGER
jgi:ABC-type uncharacterized transport system permease subunit